MERGAVDYTSHNFRRKKSTFGKVKIEEIAEKVDSKARNRGNSFDDGSR